MTSTPMLSHAISVWLSSVSGSGSAVICVVVTAAAGVCTPCARGCTAGAPAALNKVTYALAALFVEAHERCAQRNDGREVAAQIGHPFLALRARQAAFGLLQCC